MIDHHHLRAVDRDITHHQHQQYTAVVLVAIDLAHHLVAIDLAHHLVVIDLAHLLLLIIVVVGVDLDLLQAAVVDILVAMR